MIDIDELIERLYKMAGDYPNNFDVGGDLDAYGDAAVALESLQARVELPIRYPRSLGLCRKFGR